MLVILESDPGKYGIGALILHRFPNGDERPIAYASRSLIIRLREITAKSRRKVLPLSLGPQVLHVSLWTQVHFTN